MSQQDHAISLASSGHPARLDSSDALTATPKKKFKFSSLSVKSKRLLSFRGSSSKERKALSITSASDEAPRAPSPDIEGGGTIEAPNGPPVALNPDPLSHLHLVDKSDEPPIGRDIDLRPSVHGLLVQGTRTPELPIVPEVQRSASVCHERSRPTASRFSLDDTQLSYAKSMEELSENFAEHVFPGSPVFSTSIPKSEINIPFPTTIVPRCRVKSVENRTSRHDTPVCGAPTNVEIEIPRSRALKDESKDQPDPDVPKRLDTMSHRSWIRLAKTVQRAAKQLSDHEDLSPVVLFQTLAPVALFLFGIFAGIVIPRYRDELEVTFRLLGASTVPMMLFVFVLGAMATLITLKVTILLLAYALNFFCEMDLDALFYKGVCADANGKVLGERDLLLGSFLFASSSSPVAS